MIWPLFSLCPSCNLGCLWPLLWFTTALTLHGPVFYFQTLGFVFSRIPCNCVESSWKTCWNIFHVCRWKNPEKVWAIWHNWFQPETVPYSLISHVSITSTEELGLVTAISILVSLPNQWNQSIIFYSENVPPKVLTSLWIRYTSSWLNPCCATRLWIGCQ
jgi:hypothetical protein